MNKLAPGAPSGVPSALHHVEHALAALGTPELALSPQGNATLKALDVALCLLRSDQLDPAPAQQLALLRKARTSARSALIAISKITGSTVQHGPRTARTATEPEPSEPPRTPRSTHHPFRP